MKVKTYQELEIWKEGVYIVEAIYLITSAASFKHDFALKDQMRRSAISIPSNIAEGFDRNSRAELKRFLFIAKGSCAELETQLIIAYRIKYIDQNKYEALKEKCSVLSLRIGKFAAYLSNTRTPAHSKTS